MLRLHLTCYIIDEVKRIIKEQHERIARLEDQKYDLEYVVKRKDIEVVASALRTLSLMELTN